MKVSCDSKGLVPNSRAALLGLSVGDALGEQLADHAADARAHCLPPGPWPWTDDTEMACSVWHVLDCHGNVDSAVLASSFAAHYDPARKYGRSVDRMMAAVSRGADLRVLAAETFNGSGSWGNGGAMRVAPLGAYFHGDPARAASEAAESARVTHTHPEGVAGAIAVAVAAAVPSSGADLLREVLAYTPPGDVHNGVSHAVSLLGARAEDAAAELGTGARISAPDTVPLALWVAATHSADYEEAIWTAASVAVDVDTVCAIVGGIVATRVGEQGIPAAWRAAAEPLPTWLERP